MKVNGTKIIVKEDKSLYDFLIEQNYNVTKIAVEKNGVIVPKIKYKEIKLYNEDSLEIVCFVGGG